MKSHCQISSLKDLFYEQITHTNDLRRTDSSVAVFISANDHLVIDGIYSCLISLLISYSFVLSKHLGWSWAFTWWLTQTFISEGPLAVLPQLGCVDFQLRASRVAQWPRIHLPVQEMQKTCFDPWVGKIPWRKK